MRAYLVFVVVLYVDQSANCAGSEQEIRHFQGDESVMLISRRGRTQHEWIVDLQDTCCGKQGHLQRLGPSYGFNHHSETKHVLCPRNKHVDHFGSHGLLLRPGACAETFRKSWDVRKRTKKNLRVHAEAGNTETNSIVGLLARILAASPEQTNEEQEESTLWEQLGALLLKGGEYAEAHRIYRYGFSRCPSSMGLRFNSLVYNAFHGNATSVSSLLRDHYVQKGIAVLQFESHNSGVVAPPPLQEHALNLAVESVRIPDSLLPPNIRQLYKPEHQTDGLASVAYVSKDPILSRAACDYIIESATRAVERRGGWMSTALPSASVPVFEFDPEALSWVAHAMQTTLLPFVASTFQPAIDVQSDMLRIQDAYIMRYDGYEDGDGRPGFSFLKAHADVSIISLTIALNDRKDYEGGGLCIEPAGQVLNGDAGTVICFAGEVPHSGAPVVSGTRWIMTVFLYVDRNVISGRQIGYITKMMNLIQKEHRKGSSAAHWAARKGNVGVLRWLTANRLPLAAENIAGETPAHFAAQAGHVKVLEFLKAAGQDLGKQCKSGQTPAHFAAREGRLQVLQELQKLGVDFHQLDNNGETPASLADKKGEGDVVRFLNA